MGRSKETRVSYRGLQCIGRSMWLTDGPRCVGQERLDDTF